MMHRQYMAPMHELTAVCLVSKKYTISTRSNVHDEHSTTNHSLHTEPNHSRQDLGAVLTLMTETENAYVVQAGMVQSAYSTP